MKIILSILIIISLFSCSKNELNHPVITIDLKKSTPMISYSNFVDSIEHITLNTNGLFLSGIKRMYMDNDFIFMSDDKRGGIIVFSKKTKSIIKNINYYGQGHGEFSNIATFAIDKYNKKIIIYSNPNILEYTYNGDFISDREANDFFRDFSVLNNNEYICMFPSYMSEQPSGVWLADSMFCRIKDLKNDVPTTEIFETTSMYYNSQNDGVYYYDRVWDDFSFISRDTVRVLYKFDLKQRVPAKDRYKDTPDKLKNYVAINQFANSNRYIILNYFTFNNDPSYWVLYDKKENKSIISQLLYNDIDKTQTISNCLFYIDNYTWCRILDFDEDNPNIKMEILHLKN